MGIGVVMAPDDLPLLTHHRPGPLQMQRHPAARKTQGRHIRRRLLCQTLQQRGEGRVVMEAAFPMEIACPGAALLGIASGRSPQGENLLQQHSGVQGIGRQLHLAQGQGEQGLKGEPTQRELGRRDGGKGGHGTKARG